MTDNQQSNNNTNNNSDNTGKGNQGFASMPKEEVKEIAREGGKHSHDNTNSENDDNDVA